MGCYPELSYIDYRSRRRKEELGRDFGAAVPRKRADCTGAATKGKETERIQGDQSQGTKTAEKGRSKEGRTSE